MTFEQYLALFGFAFAMSATPGPNTVMLLASGVNFGVKRTLPHMVGIPFGLATLLLAVGLGLGALVVGSPMLHTAMKSVSAVYMLWLAWKIATAAPIKDGAAAGQPMTFVEAALFQWINPKAWVMSIGAISAYTLPERYALTLAILIATMVAISVPISLAWSGLGASLRALLQRPAIHRTFNIAMALLLVASLWPILVQLRATLALS